MMRELRWVVGAALVAVAAILVMLSTPLVAPAGLEAAVLVAGLLLVVTAVVMGYFLSEDAWERVHWERRPGRYRRLSSWHALGGVLVLWIVAGAASVYLGLGRGSDAALLVVAILALLGATLAFLWGDFVQPGPPPEAPARPPSPGAPPRRV